MPGYKELELHSRFNRVEKLGTYLERNMKDFCDSYAPYCK